MLDMNDYVSLHVNFHSDFQTLISFVSSEVVVDDWSNDSLFHSQLLRIKAQRNKGH